MSRMFIDHFITYYNEHCKVKSEVKSVNSLHIKASV